MLKLGSLRPTSMATCPHTQARTHCTRALSHKVLSTKEKKADCSALLSFESVQFFAQLSASVEVALSQAVAEVDVKDEVSQVLDAFMSVHCSFSFSFGELSPSF